jgi:hypothetical protein
MALASSRLAESSAVTRWSTCVMTSVTGTLLGFSLTKSLRGRHPYASLAVDVLRVARVVGYASWRAALPHVSRFVTMPTSLPPIKPLAVIGMPEKPYLLLMACTSSTVCSGDSTCTGTWTVQSAQASCPVGPAGSRAEGGRAQQARERGNHLRVGNEAIFEVLHTIHLLALFLDRIVVVDEPNAAVQRHLDGHLRLCHLHAQCPHTW